MNFDIPLSIGELAKRIKEQLPAQKRPKPAQLFTIEFDPSKEGDNGKSTKE